MITKATANWPRLQAGDLVEVIAPASRFSAEYLAGVQQLCAQWQLQCHVPQDLLGEDLLCANSDAKRFTHLKAAISNPQAKAIFCIRGGYGSARLLPLLATLSPPSQSKIFVGMSDITALNTFLIQKWNWPVVHAAAIPGRFSESSLQALHDLLFQTQLEFPEFIPLNLAAQQSVTITAPIVGGNLAIVQTTLGTPWQLDAHNKILFLEEVRERGYRIDRMLTHLRQAGLLNNVKAILFGDFIEGNEADGSSLIEPVLKRFAEQIAIPVLQCKGIGHDKTNYPVPLGMPVTLQL